MSGAAVALRPAAPACALSAAAGGRRASAAPRRRRPEPGFRPERFRRLRPAQDVAPGGWTRRLRAAAIWAAAMLSPGAAGAAVLVDVDALTDDWHNPVIVSLAAGVYEISLVDAAFTAWNAWGGEVSGCDANGENCAKGWLNSGLLRLAEGDLRLGDASLRYADAAAAFDAFAPVSLTLLEDQEVLFLNPDSWHADNLGGLSYSIARLEVPAGDLSAPPPAVPLPSSLPLAAAGMVALSLLRRRKA